MHPFGNFSHRMHELNARARLDDMRRRADHVTHGRLHLAQGQRKPGPIGRLFAKVNPRRPDTGTKHATAAEPQRQQRPAWQRFLRRATGRVGD